MTQALLNAIINLMHKLNTSKPDNTPRNEEIERPRLEQLVNPVVLPEAGFQSYEMFKNDPTIPEQAALVEKYAIQRELGD